MESYTREPEEKVQDQTMPEDVHHALKYAVRMLRMTSFLDYLAFQISKEVHEQNKEACDLADAWLDTHRPPQKKEEEECTTGEN